MKNPPIIRSTTRDGFYAPVQLDSPTLAAVERDFGFTKRMKLTNLWLEFVRPNWLVFTSGQDHAYPWQYGLMVNGPKWLVKDQPNDGALRNEYMTWKFLHEQPDHSIPLVKEMRRFADPEDPIQLTLISRASGKELAWIWDASSPEQKFGYRDQLVNILKQLQQFTAPFPQKVNGDKRYMVC